MAKKKIEYFEKILLGRSCFICSETMSVEEADKGNWPVRMPNVGAMHRKCRGNCTVNLMQNPVETENLAGQVNELLGGKDA